MPRPRADRARPPAATPTHPQRLAYGHHARVFDVALAPSNTPVTGWLASAGEDEAVRLWSPRAEGASPAATDYDQAAAARGHGEPVLRVAWAPGGDCVASAGADCCARVWRLARDGGSYNLTQAVCLGPVTEEGYACEFVHGTACLVTTDGADIAVWDVETGVRAPTIAPPPQPPGPAADLANPRWAEAHVFGVALAPGPRPLAVGACSDGAARVWSIDATGATPIAAVRPFASVAAGAAWLVDGFTVTLVATDGTVAALDSRALARGPVWRAALGGPAAGIAGVGGDVAIATGSGRVVVLHGATGAITHTLAEGRVPAARPLLCVAASPDGTIAASGEPIVEGRDGGAPARASKWAPVTVWAGWRGY